jgi:2,3-dihydroxybenzoate-AMP ligase
MTYDELFSAAARLAGGLIASTDLRPGDAVMFQMGNVAETVLAYLGCLLAGLRPVCTQPQHGEREIALLARHIGARGLLVQADFGRRNLTDNARPLQDSGTVRTVVVFRGKAFGEAVSSDDVIGAGASADLESLPFRTLDPWQIAVFQLSGGTTGLPKVAPRMHEEYAYNGRAWAGELGWGPGSVVLYPLPIIHNAGINAGLQPALLSGATLVLAASADTGTILDLIEAHRPGVPDGPGARQVQAPRARGAGGEPPAHQRRQGLEARTA